MILFAIFVNRVRGGLFKSYLPTRNVFLAGPLLIVGLFFSQWFNLYQSLILGIGFLLWGIPAWHIWIQPTFSPATIIDPWYVRVFDLMGFHTWFGGFFFRHFICLLPLLISLHFIGFASWTVIPLAILLTMSYWLSYQIHGMGDGIGDGENFAGIAWGLFLISLHLL